MITILKQRSLSASVLFLGALLIQTGCAGSDKGQAELATDVTQAEPAEAPSHEPAAEAQPAPGTETAAAPDAGPSALTAAPAAATAAPAAATAAPADGRARVVRYVAAKEAVLRATPSDNSPKVGVLAKGERVMVVEENGWGRVADDMFVKLNALSSKAVPRNREKASWSKPAH